MAATAATTKITARAAVASWTLFFRARDVDRQRAVGQFGTVHGGNSFLRFFGRGHGDEGEATRTSAHPVHHEVGFHDGAVGRKCLLQLIFGCVEGKISNKQFRAHLEDLLFKPAAFRGPFPNAGFQIITEQGSPEDFP